MPRFDFGDYWQLLLVFFLGTVDAGYKNMLDIRTLYAIPNDVLIIGIHCTLKIFIHFLYLYYQNSIYVCVFVCLSVCIKVTGNRKLLKIL